MAEIRPFRGTFFNKDIVEDMSRVTAPPYDVIDEQRRQYLLSRSPYNIVRLIMSQSRGDRKFWKNSSAIFQAWKKGKILNADNAAFIYVYRQTFGVPGAGSSSRTGILTALKCKEFSDGDILPHEKTFAHIHRERLNLLRACRANFSQIFTIFRDPEEKVLPLLEEAVSNPAFMEYTDEEGIGHQLWRIDEPSWVNGLIGALSRQRLIIADGHHRYETALIYGGEDPGAEGTDHPRRYVSTTLFRSEDTGLVVLPVHRMLRSLAMPADEAYERVGRYFHVEVIEKDMSVRRGMFQDRMADSSRPCFIMITSRGAALLRMREGVDPTRIMKGPQSAKWKTHDISILHELVIGESLGMDADGLAEKGDLYFTPWESKALSGVAEGEVEAAFLVRPTRMSEVWDIAEGGERMPHKSTYFYPKLPSGLVIYDHENAFL